MNKALKHIAKIAGILLVGLIFSLPVTGQTVNTAKDSTANNKPVKQIVDSPEHVSKELQELRKRKGTAMKKKGDQDMDTLNQKIVETSDQDQDVIKEKEIITDTVKEKKVDVSDKIPNTEALPTAPTQLINTMDVSNGAPNTKTATSADSNITVNNKYNASLQTQKNTQLNSLFTTTLLHDSMMAENNKDFLFNNVTITNVSSAKLSLLVTIDIPNGWQTVTDKVITVNLEPNASTVVYLRIAPFNLNSAGWKHVNIEYRNIVTGDSRSDFFNVKVKEFSKFKARLLNPNMVLPGYQKIISVPVYIKNSGNTDGKYVINCTNDFLHLDAKASIQLRGGADTNYRISLVMSENEWTMMKKEEIKIEVKSGSDAYNLIQTISRVGYVLKEHSSAYADMPLQLEAGTTTMGSMATQYYGGLYGTVDLDSKDKIAIALRTNTISKDEVLNNGLMRLDYTGAHVSASIGNINEMTDFFMDGYGAKAGYNWGKYNSKIVLYSQLQSRVGDSKVFGTNMQFGLNDKIKLLSSVAADLDNGSKLNSSIARQTIDMKLSDKLRLAIVGGVSMEQSTAKLVSNTQDNIIGGSFGYNLQLVDKHISIMSSAVFNSNGFSGVYKGQRVQSHDIRLLANKFFVGGYYEYNYKEQTQFSDSILVQNVFGASSENYGARTGYSGNMGNIILSGGQQKQLQSGEGNNFEMIFNYLNVNTTINLVKKWNANLNLNSYAGNGSAPDANVKDILITSTMGTLNIKNSGIAFRYDKGPFYYSDFASYVLHPDNIERTLVSPYVDLQFFKEQLNVRAQYNYSEAVPNKTTSANLMLNLSYANPLKGYDMHITGTLPTQGDANNVYLNASVRMRLNAPFVLIRKYYRVKIMLFKDENGNGRKEDSEEPIIGQMVSVNGNLFVSDEDGMLVYQNVAKGMFKADFGYTSKVKGWAPRDGVMQTFEVKGNSFVTVPYRKSKVLSGKLNVQIDSNSNLRFDPSKIKVTAKSDDNTTYSTLTDDDGEFYFNLPSGHYTVTLSDVAFDEHFRPTQFSQIADMQNNETKTLYFEIRQRKRTININK